jgi:L-lactate dehydrogenase complex protein LldG
MDAAREETLGKVRAALGKRSGTQPAGGMAPAISVPSTARVAPRTAGAPESELEQLLAEIRKLSGVTRRLASRDELRAALAELVRAEAVKKATLWTTPDITAWDIAGSLKALGVEIVPPQADKRLVAECELGVTGVDAALAETGTLLLRSAPDRPRVVSLLPRVHLAILTPAALRPDLHQAFDDAKDAGYSVLVTGPSRTADIELTLTLGVHGPRSLYAWVMDTQ